MSKSAFSLSALKQKQSLPIEAKIVLSQERIRQWYDYFDGNVYLAFSSDPKSTVLKYLIEDTAGVPKIPYVFIKTTFECTLINEFVKNLNDIIIITPDEQFNTVAEELEKYQTKTGYKPFMSNIAEGDIEAQEHWLSHGCNAYYIESPVSNPLSVWKSQDILQYIYDKKINYCDKLYGKIHKDIKVKYYFVNYPAEMSQMI